jgi:pimeloyl-ACP methyl ester carboxylesterase
MMQHRSVLTGAVDRARDWLYAGAWQIRALGPTTADDYRSGDGQPIVVLPGIYETWHFLRPIMDVLHAAGHPIHVVPALRYNLQDIPASAQVVMELLRREGIQKAILLAHSKGGLIGKYAMTLLDPDHRIDRMVTIATPFAGSEWARFAPVRHLRIFSAVDPVMSALARELQANARITSIWGVEDTLVPHGAELTGATNIHLDAPGHFQILSNPLTIDAVMEAVHPGRRGAAAA